MSVCQSCEEHETERYRRLHEEMWQVCNVVSATCVRNYEVIIDCDDSITAMIVNDYYQHN